MKGDQQNDNMVLSGFTHLLLLFRSFDKSRREEWLRSLQFSPTELISRNLVVVVILLSSSFVACKFSSLMKIWGDFRGKGRNLVGLEVVFVLVHLRFTGLESVVVTTTAVTLRE